MPDPFSVDLHAGTCLALAPDVDGAGFLSGGDDGRLVRLAPDGTTEVLDDVPRGWFTHIAASPRSGLRAAAAGRIVRVREVGGERLHELEHPSSVGGLTFDASGKRLAVAHYGGATLWEWRKGRFRASRYPWQGSHTAITWSPCGKYIVTTMQENALHGWRVRDKLQLRMSGYPGKIRSLDWSAEGLFLVTAGARRAVVWSFAGKDGPMDRRPTEIGDGDDRLVRRVACHPRGPWVAVGHADGRVQFCHLDETVPSILAKEGGELPITALGFNSDGRFLAIGDEAGDLVWVSIDPTLLADVG
ncbi:MAG: WD40 repeat domain-containing protein [Pseudomonadota bacterium]